MFCCVFGSGPRAAARAAGMLTFGAAAIAHPPDGFADRLLGVQFSEAVGLRFDFSGRMYVWEKGGRVWTVDGIGPGGTGGVRHPTPLIDLSEEVGAWGDHGLLGFALDPNFATNGYIYLLYVVDYHHAKWFGTTNYNPTWDEYWRDTIGRLVRYTARAEDDFRSVDPASRLVLIGDTMQNGFPVCYSSHSAGSLNFGEDGTLLLSFGDGASFGSVDVGGPVEGWNTTCVSEGIVRAGDEDVGALRAQLLTSMSGKLLRLDPASGAGVPSNPFYDAKAPQSPASKVWAWGLRNPYRFTMRPKTGNPDPAAADPGTVYLGDVGWTRWEELNVAPSGGVNFGWPLYEGLQAHPEYTAAATVVQNRRTPNPLYGLEGCPAEFFTFTQVLTQATLNAPQWPNPCDILEQVPEQPHRVMHARPVIDWYHFEGGTARAATFDETGIATATNLSAPGSPVQGPDFRGSTSIGGAWVTGDAWPKEWRDTYFHADFTGEWIKAFTFDEQDRPQLVRNFANELGSIVDLEWDETRQALWYVRFTREGICELRALAPDSNLDPLAVAEAEPTVGPGPLSVSFKGDGSQDPEAPLASYHWDFGDGTTSDEANPTHVYASTDPVGPARYDAELTVTDSVGQTHTAGVSVWVDNTAPKVEITSPEAGATMPPTGFAEIELKAIVSDAEHAKPGQVTCRWLVILHHDSHTHLIGTVEGCDGAVSLTPHPCEGSSYSYEFVLEATDALGLTGQDKRVMLPADCNANGVPDNCDIAGGAPDINGNGVPDECELNPTCPADWDGNGVVNSTDVSEFINDWFEDMASGTLVTDFDGNGAVNSTDVSEFINAYFESHPLCLG